MREPNKVLMLMQHCNSAVTNQNEYMISSAIIRRVVQNEDLAIEQIADEANISQASVSRFVRKAGFDSWQSFRENCTGACHEIGQRRFVYDVGAKASKSLEDIKTDIYKAMMDNLTSTNDSLDYEKIDSILSLLESAKEVVFLGDEHALSIFYTLQLELRFAGIPAYLYKNSEVQEGMAGRVGPGTVVVFLNIENNFISKSQENVVEKMKKHGAAIIVFSQQDVDGILKYDHLYKYGIAGSHNNGYYSLFFLSQILSAALISRSFSKNESRFQRR